MKKIVRVLLEIEVDDKDDVLESGNTHQVRVGDDGDGDIVLWLDGCATENVDVIEMEEL